MNEIAYIWGTNLPELEKKVNQKLQTNHNEPLPWKVVGTIVVDTDHNGTLYIQAIVR